MFRSLLFIPGNNPSMLQNADVFLADAIIFDLEDAISIFEKNNARNLINNYLVTSGVLPKQVILRVNAFDSEWFEQDIQLLKTKKIDYLLIPKIDRYTIKEVEEKLDQFEKSHNLPRINIIALVETAKGIRDLSYLAENKRVKAILLGAEDLANDLEIKRTDSGNEILFARSEVIFSCAANNLIAIDTPYTDILNSEGLKKDCLYAASLGMKAKACIHPNQLELVNLIFSPSQEEINWAIEIVKIHQGKPEVGAFQYQGKMIDKPIIERAIKIIEKAKQFDLM